TVLLTSRRVLRSSCPPATASPDIATLSLHDALPISVRDHDRRPVSQHDVQPLLDLRLRQRINACRGLVEDDDRRVLDQHPRQRRSEEHTSELQSRENLVCRLLLEKKKNICRKTDRGE